VTVKGAECGIDATAFPLKVIILVSHKQGIICVYNPTDNYQIVFFSFTYEEAKLWLENHQYKPIEQRFQTKKVA
jgi:hypothetical protein